MILMILMILRSRAARMAFGLALVVAFPLTASPLQAASLNHGNFAIPSQGLTFENVTESSGTDGVPLFDAPSAFVVGLDFDPTAFLAASNGGGADITDGQLNFALQAEPGQAIGAVAISEGGAFTLVGGGTAASQVLAGVNMSIVVTQIDGVPVAPVSLGSVNQWLSKNLLADPGLLQPWSLNVSMNVATALAALGHTFTVGATRIEAVVDNSLVALSEPVSIARISKTDFRIDVTPDPHGFPSPEPTGLALIAAAIALGSHTRRIR